MNNPNIKINMVLRGDNKEMYRTVITEFAELVLKNSDKTVKVLFGKQDSRGSLSICQEDELHRIHHQEFFDSTKEMVDFIRGYLKAIGDSRYDPHRGHK